MEAWKVKVDVLVALGDKVINKKEAAEHQLALAQGAKAEVSRTLASLHAHLPATIEAIEDIPTAEAVRDGLVAFANVLEARSEEVVRAISVCAARAVVLKELVNDIATDVRVTMDAIERKAAYDALPEEEKAQAKRPAGAKPPKGKVAQARKARAAKAKEEGDGPPKG